ncbi:MAG TPA: hypothetical protein VET87_03205 [Rubrivivax sp.]|nr:hypothetical protein [Rubrivivax sp.]
MQHRAATLHVDIDVARATLIKAWARTNPRHQLAPCLWPRPRPSAARLAERFDKAIQAVEAVPASFPTWAPPSRTASVGKFQRSSSSLWSTWQAKRKSGDCHGTLPKKSGYWKARLGST